MISEGQEFTQATPGQLASTAICLGLQLEDLKAGTWNYLKAGSLTSLTFDSSCQLRPELGQLAGTRTHVAWASAQHGG